MEIVFQIDEISLAAKQFIIAASGYKIYTFTGDLGAGKTTFIDAVCKELGVIDAVTSPTYSLIHEYRTIHKEIIYHIDAYRLASSGEAIDAGLEECIFSGEICMIEWPSKISFILPGDIVASEIFILNQNQRKLVVELH
ncbi:MAG: tRNA (adenosine(37)-N6)-threonylcarbamoyltransferase complex ATPase subunit type 1 TsaE [Ginsengibacter sp.]